MRASDLVVTLCLLHVAGRPWNDASKLEDVAKMMHERWQLAAESGSEAPQVQPDWMLAAKGGEISASSAGGELERHMLAHVTGVGPSLFKVYFACVCLRLVLLPLWHGHCQAHASSRQCKTGAGDGAAGRRQQTDGFAGQQRRLRAAAVAARHWSNEGRAHQASMGQAQIPVTSHRHRRTRAAQ